MQMLMVLPVDATVSIVTSLREKLTSVGHFFLECVACLNINQVDIILVASRIGTFNALLDVDSLFIVLTV